MARKMTPSEEIVGRRLPAYPAHKDTLLAGFIDEDGKAIGRTNPNQRHLMPAFLVLRRSGLIRRGMTLSFGGRPGKLDGVWYLRDGDAVYQQALAAKKRVDDIMEARKQWSRDLKDRYLNKRTDDEQPEHPEQT